MKRIYILFLFALYYLSCTQNQSGQETFIINSKGAVFYSPDSLKIEELKAEWSEEDFYTIVDDYQYYLSQSREFLEKNQLPISYTKKSILKFVKYNGEQIVIEIDTLMPIWGIYLFDPEKDPILTDMTLISPDYHKYFEE